MKSIMIILSLFCFLNPNIYAAAVEMKKFESDLHEQRYKNLIDELRCLVCQNQNLADSNSELAQDLRNKVYKMINDGQSDQEVMDFMVTRYGDFVLYRPPFKASTFLLWIGPFIILIIGLLVLVNFIRHRKRNVITALSNNEKEKLKQLLNDNKGKFK